MPTDMTFRLFGPLEVADGLGRPLDLGTRKQRALVAMLALEPGRVVSLDRLIDELWTGEPPAGATRTLQAYIAHLRKVLEPDRPPRMPPRILLTREPGYLLAVAPGQVDLTRFTAWAAEGRRALARGAHAEALRVLERALDLWRGDPLGEFADQEFAQPVVARLGELCDTAVEDRFEARLALGESGTCVPDLEALVETYPYRERLWGLLVLALYRAGRQADALAALRRVRARLAGDLGIEPGPELRRLEQAVFEQASGLEARPVAPAVLGTPAAPDGSGTSTVPAPPPVAAVAPWPAGTAAGEGPVAARAREGLVARQEQLLRLEERLAEVRRGHGGTVLITGEAGIGKTRLAQAAADQAAARGFGTAWGRSVDGTAPAFWPWTQVLRALGADAGLLTGETPRGQDPDAALFELYGRVVSVLTSTGGPLLVLLEDLHWADASSLGLLSFVAGELAGHPVLVVATLRPEPGEHPGQLRDTLAALSREQATERVALDPFDAAGVSSYLRSRRIDGAPELVALLLERTGGNPFYLGELLRLRESEHGLLDAVPPGARDVIERRVARLPEETRELLRAAAVTGREVDVDLLGAITGLPAEPVMSLLEPAVATGLLAETPGGFDYRFSHALVRDALYAGLSRLERARLHLRAGRALEPLLPEAESATLAHHFALAAKVGGAAKAVEHASRAARHATAQLAYTEAVEFWELALAALPPGDGVARSTLLAGLGEARRTVGQAEAAHRDLEEAVELALRAGDRAALVSAITVLGGPAMWHWRSYGEVDGRMVEVIEDLLAGPLTERDRAALLGTLALELYYGPRRAEGERHAAEAVKIARRVGDTALLARTLNNYMTAVWVPGSTPERLRAAEEMLALPGLPRAAELVARISRMACLLRMGDLAGWDRDLARCRRLLGQAPRPELEGMVRIAETARRTLDGRWEEAESLLGRFGAMRFGSSRWGERFRLLVTTYTCRRGQGRAAEVVDELVAAAEDPQLVPLRPVAVLAALEAGRPDLARELVGRWGTEVGEDWIADFLIPVWGLVAARLGVPDPGECYDRLLPYADQLIVAGMGSAGWGSTHLVLAELAGRLGRTAAARDHARAALETHRDLGLTHLEEESRALLARLAG
ncbi:BTAD domain-containing putative transcriptional regulator [Streptosporangium sp. NPDC003464]